MIQWLLRKTVQFAQYGQGIGAAGRPNARTDRAVLQKLKLNQAVIFDVGANKGDFVQLALGASAIHAFEPSQAAYTELTRRFANRTDVHLNNLALGSEPGERTLYYDVPGSELSSLYPRQIDHHGIQMTGSELVKVETLDHHCAAHGINYINLLKLDVEGHELEVLRGAELMFANKQIALVSFEFGGCNVDSRTFMRDFWEFFHTRQMKLARVTAFGSFEPISNYDEHLEQFRTTTFVASLP